MLTNVLDGNDIVYEPEKPDIEDSYLLLIEEQYKNGNGDGYPQTAILMNNFSKTKLRQIILARIGTTIECYEDDKGAFDLDLEPHIKTIVRHIKKQKIHEYVTLGDILAKNKIIKSFESLWPVRYTIVKKKIDFVI